MSYRINHTALTVIWTDPRTGETSDLNVGGEPCETLEDLRGFVRELCAQGFLDADVRDQLLHDVGRDEPRLPTDDEQAALDAQRATEPYVRLVDATGQHYRRAPAQEREDGWYYFDAAAAECATSGDGWLKVGPGMTVHGPLGEDEDAEPDTAPDTDEAETAPSRRLADHPSYKQFVTECPECGRPVLSGADGRYCENPDCDYTAEDGDGRGRALVRAEAYLDDQDPRSVGWAYRLTFSDGHQESGPLDADIDDRDSATTEIGALVAAYDGGDEVEVEVEE